MANAIAMALAVSLAQSGGDAPVLVLVQQKVPAYAQVLKGFSTTHRGVSDEIDVDTPEAVEAAAGRSPEVVVALGSKALEIAKTRWLSAAVIAAAVSGADASGRSALTAVPLETKSTDALSLLSALAPSVKKVVAFYAANNSQLLADAKQAAQATKLNITFVPIADAAALQAQFKPALAGQEAAWVMADTRWAKPELFDLMAQSCLEAKIPLVGFNEAMVQAGGLAAITVDYKEVGREAARFATDVATMAKAQRGSVPFRYAAGKVTVSEKTMSTLGLRGKPPEKANILR